MMPDAYHMPISIVHRALSIAPYALCMIHNAIFYALCISYAHTHKNTDMDLCVCACTYLQKEDTDNLSHNARLFLLGITPMEYLKEQWLFCQCFS